MPGIRRRDFVKSMSAAGTGLLLSSRFGWAAQRKPDPDVKRVLVMFKCHFDAGFIDTQWNVVHRYFQEYFPRAIEVARTANTGGKRRYVWTTGSWLLYEYLDQASPTERAAAEQAIARGDLAWHALPFTWQTEMMSQSLIEGSLALSQELDKRFGKATTGAKMTDVPGHTRGLIAPLAKHGVGFLEIGVNGGSTAADLPSLFLWKAPSGAGLPVMYHWEYGGVARIPGTDVALVTRVRDDNSGPHSLDEIARMHAQLREQFPNAEISACDLSAMARAIAPHREALPVVTEEIGDTWIHGVASDPLKVARYREVMRLREQWIAAGKLRVGDPNDVRLLRKLLLEVEHTWGTDTKTWLDFDHYEPMDLQPMLDTKNYKVVEFSWVEKRQDLLDAVADLPETERAEAQLSLAALTPRWPSKGTNARTVGDSAPIETAHYVLQIDPKTGAIVRLQNKATQREWASASHPIGLFSYQTLSKQDYDRFIKSYLTTTADWAFKDFGKPNIERYGAMSEEWEAAAATISVEETEVQHRIVAELHFKDDAAFASGRAAFPRIGFIEITLPKSDAVMEFALSWSGKPATRMPEALWLTFNPEVEDPRGWMLDKTNEPVSPFDVIQSGNRHMHALMNGFEYRSKDHSFAVETLDAPVVALGAKTPLLFSNEQPDLNNGIHSCLFNNAWGTNYIMWYGEDARFRYRIRA